MRKENIILIALPLAAMLVFAGIVYSATSVQVTATVRVLPPYPHNTQFTINNSGFFFYGSLYDKDSGAVLPYRPVKLTVDYMYRGALRKVVLSTLTFAGGSWFIPFNGDWKTAKIEFLGDSRYRPSSVTIKK